MGNGRNKDFYFTFPFFSRADIVVKLNGKSATGYGVFCIPGTNNNDFPFTGGRIHFAHAPKATDQVTIERKLQYNRLVDYQPTERLNPTTVNQDMNYFFELLKDIKRDLETYATFTDTESVQDLLNRIDAITEELNNIDNTPSISPDLTNIETSITNLTNSVNDLITTTGTHTTEIGTLNTFQQDVFDYVIETQLPTSSNNYTWYRKYKSGWVEMGGTIPVKTTTINLPIELSNTNYTVVIVYKLAGNNSNSATFSSISTHSQTTTKFTIARAETTVKGWYISYMSAQN